MKAWINTVMRRRRRHAVALVGPGLRTDWLQAALLTKPKPKLTSQQLADKVLPWVYVLAVAVVLATSGHAHAKGPADELQKAVEALRAAAPGSEVQKRAGQKVCQIAVGPLGVALWTPAGSLICRRVTDVDRK